MDALALPGCRPSRAAWWGRPPCPQPRAQLFVTSLVIANNTNFGDLAAISSRLKNSPSLSLENAKTHVSILQMDQQTRPGHFLNPPSGGWSRTSAAVGTGAPHAEVERDDPLKASVKPVRCGGPALPAPRPSSGP